MKQLIVLLLIATITMGCASSNIERSENPINRSILLDGGITLGLDIPIIPIPLPKINFDIRLHYRRPTPREEIELNLSKIGKQLEPHNQVPKEQLKASPTPFSVKPKE